MPDKVLFHLNLFLYLQENGHFCSQLPENFLAQYNLLCIHVYISCCSHVINTISNLSDLFVCVISCKLHAINARHLYHCQVYKSPIVIWCRMQALCHYYTIKCCSFLQNVALKSHNKSGPSCLSVSSTTFTSVLKYVLLFFIVVFSWWVDIYKCLPFILNLPILLLLALKFTIESDMFLYIINSIPDHVHLMNFSLINNWPVHDYPAMPDIWSLELQYLFYLL